MSELVASDMCEKDSATQLWDHENSETPSAIKYNVIDELQSESVETIREIVCRDALPFAVIIYNCNGNLNVGNIIRTTMVFGGIDVWIVGRRKLDIRSAVGAHHYINLRRIPEIPHPVGAFFRREKLFPVLIEQGGTSLDEFDMRSLIREPLPPYSERPCFVFGAENFGIPDEFIADCRKEFGEDTMRLISIPQAGYLRSLNVSAAASIILYQFQRACLELRRDSTK